MRWLHLTDIHVGRPDEVQHSAIRSLLAAIRAFGRGKPFDAVVFTGDIANAGKRAEYESFEKLVLAALRADPLFANASFIAVPGNHDVDCDRALPCSWEQLDNRRRSKWFSNDSDGQLVRGPRTAAFTEYSEFIKRNSLLGLDPIERCSHTFRVTVRDMDVSFVTLNTALFSDMARSDEKIAPAPTHALRTELQDQKTHAAKIVLGHHPISWFSHVTQEPFRSVLLENHAIYIHGHLHQVRVTHTPHGIEALGFGAVYQAPLDAAASGYYENSFAICELSDVLHVAVYVWDAVNGRWCVNNRLPADFSTKSRALEDGHEFPVPGGKRLRVGGGSPEGLKRRARPETLLAVGIPSASSWWRLLTLIGEVKATEKPSSQVDLPGEVEFLLAEPGGVRLIRCIAGQGRILSVREIEAENTRLDTGEHEAVTIVSLGRAEDVARQLAIKFGRKKAFRLLCSDDVAAAIAQRLSGPVAQCVDAVGVADSALSYLLDEDGIGLIVEDGTRGDWFYVLGAGGECLLESSPVVRKLREVQSSISRAAYRPPGEVGVASPPSNGVDTFDRERYLRACQAEFDAIKYAPLAALGFKFPKAKLMDVYVPARAELGDQRAQSEQLRQALDDFLDTLELDETTRAHVRAQMVDKYFGTKREGGSARAFYQQHRNVLVLGDPGSGKTCFVKHEILSYCNPTENDGSWYRLHTPLFIPLVEVAQLLTANAQLLDMCATIAARRGLQLQLRQLEALCAGGQIAFFFDGLDEVPSVEQRARILEGLAKLVSELTPLGNRFVLTSRPAAVDSIDMPAGLTPVHLRHLSHEEVRQLAYKILSMGLTERGEKVGVRAGEEANDESSIVEALLADCVSKPGIGRLARNPLLLSLLVMIYANAGAPAAKKHRIYAQAVATLVSVRNRAAGQPVLSEADLRKRLGRTALAIYDGELPELPSRQDVAAIIAQVLTDEGAAAPVAAELADGFVQRVAEETGLLAIHRMPGDFGAATITFMHHSFMEYYAAVGLVAQRRLELLPSLANSKRWREVVSLAAGLIGDQADVTPLVRQIVDNASFSDRVTGHTLLFAFDCALECDVPPEKAQAALISATRESLARGAARVDATVRKDLAERTARLYEAAGSQVLADFLVEGLENADERVAAAFADLIGVVGVHARLPAEVVSAFEEFSASRASVSRIALCQAIERCAQLRTERILRSLELALSGNFSVKFAAVRTLESVPDLAKRFSGQLVQNLDDMQAPIAAAASRALLEAGIGLDLDEPISRLRIEKALRRWEQMAEPRSAAALKLKVPRDVTEEMLSSPTQGDRVLALRLLPWLERQEQFIYERLFEAIAARRSGPETIAALASVRLAPGISALITSHDIGTIVALAGDSNVGKDVRVAAIRALAAVPAGEKTLDCLLGRCENSTQSEYREAIRAIAVAAPEHPRVREFLAQKVREGMAGPLRNEFGKPAKQYDWKRVMRVAAELRIELPDAVADALVALVNNPRAPMEMRAQALRTYARCSPATLGTIEQFIEWLQIRMPTLESIVAGNIPEVLRRVRRRVDSVRAVYPRLEALELAVVAEWQRIGPQNSRFIHDVALQGLRAALVEVREMRSGFGEFAVNERKSVPLLDPS